LPYGAKGEEVKMKTIIKFLILSFELFSLWYLFHWEILEMGAVILVICGFALMREGE
jgi:hypothetical protein